MVCYTRQEKMFTKNTIYFIVLNHESRSSRAGESNDHGFDS